MEETVNADAASQKTGISYFANSISARQRWAYSHFVRMEVLSEVLNKLDMTTTEDVSFGSFIKDPKEFEERISWHKILNFANEDVSYSLRETNNKLMAVEMIRDLFWKYSFLDSQSKN